MTAAFPLFPHSLSHENNVVSIRANSGAEQYAQTAEAVTSPISDAQLANGPGTNSTVDDKDVRRLDDRIDSVRREEHLRLEAVLARLEGQFGRIADQTANIRQELGSQRDDARVQRTELNEAIKSSIAVTRSWAMWIIGSMFAVAAIGIAVDIGLRQVWVMGVQVGQASSSVSTSAPAPPASKQ